MREPNGGASDRPGDPVRVAVLGYGLGGAAFHAPVIAATPGLEVAAIVTGNAERAAEARSRYPGAAVVPDADALWRRSAGLDAAVVATPNRTHVPLAMAALEAGLDVVVDKPLAPSVDDARRLIEEADRRGRVLTVYHNRRWDGDFRTLQSLLDRGELGEVHRLESRFERWRPDPKPGWRQSADPQDAGGTLFDLGSHLIDQALVLFGPVRDVYAEIDLRRPGARVDDDVFLALTHESGVRSHLSMTALAARLAPRFRVLGSKGTWTKYGLDVQESALRAGADPGAPAFGEEPESAWGTLDDGEGTRRTPTATGAYTAFYAAFEGAVRTGAPPPVEAADGLAVLDVIERARAAAR